MGQKIIFNPFRLKFFSADLEHSLSHCGYRLRRAEQRGRQKVGPRSLVPRIRRLPRTRLVLKLSRLSGSKTSRQIRTNKEDEPVGMLNTCLL
jgi:hypothetical protein